MPYRIPQTNNKYYISNGSDFTPNVQYVRNIDFDEAGYAKLSPPFPKLTGSSEDANFDTFLDAINLGTSPSQEYKFVTDSSIYDVELNGAPSATVDASAPTSNVSEARFVGWKGGDWYFNAPSDIYSLQSTAGTVWDIENTDSITYAEVFVNKNTLVGGNASNILQYTTANMDGTTPTGDNSGTTLALPANFELMGLAYSNYRIGVATRNTTGGNAYFFTWDGSTTDAGQGIPVYGNMILDVVAYKNSWVILTSAGQVLYFNGGGFDVLGNLPCYYFNANWVVYGGSQTHGRTMQVDGDVIYFNLGSLLESSDDDSGILKGFYSGVWCYDPDLGGIYHRYGLSNSKLYGASLNATATVFTSTAHQLLTGDKVRHHTSKTTYFAIYVTDDTFKLADTYDLAVAGTATSDNVDGMKTWIKREDWTQSVANNNQFGACIKFSNGSLLPEEGHLPFFAGLTVTTKTRTTSEKITCLMAQAFDNIGCINYYKIKSENIEDNWQSVIVKHRKLFHNDKIVIKYKIRDYYNNLHIGEAGDITPDDSTANYVTWTSTTTFTTTKDLSEVEVGDEVEFMSGAGAGSTAHVSTISESSGTYTVTVDEAIRGGAVGNFSTCIFDSFVKAGVITKDNQELNNIFRQPIDRKSKWIQVKLELRGNNVAIEEVIINNSVDRPII